MLGRTYEGQNCSIAKSLELIGSAGRCSIVREVFLGNRRFDEMAARLDIARNVLTTRLQRLVEEGVLTKVRYQERPERFEYRLTEKGIDLWPVIVSLLQFGDRYYAPDGPPMLLVHKPTSVRRPGRRAPRYTASATPAARAWRRANFFVWDRARRG